MAATARADELTLGDALRTTLENNPAILEAKASVERAGGRRLVLRSVALPDALVGMAGGDQGGHRAGEKSNQLFGFGYGAFTQPIFDAAIPASYRRANIELLIAEQQLNVAVQDQLHTTRIAFYTALYNRALGSLRDEQRTRLADNVRSLKERYEAGLVDRAIYVGAEVQAREVDPKVESSRRGYDGAILKLTETMGRTLEKDASLPLPKGDLTYAKIDVDLDAASAHARETRADLKLARLMVRAAEEDQRIIVAGYYPQIDANIAGEYIPVSGIRRQSQGSPRRSDDIISSEVRIGGSYTWRVIDNGKVYGASQRQQKIKEINELELKKLEASIPRTLSRIRNELEGIATKQKELLLATSAAEQNAVIIQQNLAGGIASPLEARLIENSSLDAKSALVSLAFQQKMALAEWDRATGRYLQFSDDPAGNVP